ncbi:thiamine pyrophosphate-dependent dehydrogenase E1 component subunit alpha [Candidatus Omnitrophota bacterium]
MKYSTVFLKSLYETMVRIRLCEESLVGPILNGEIRCPVHLYSGEEAVATGVCAALDEKDYVFGTHRSHGHFLAKGGGACEMIAEIYGKITGCAGGRGGSMHLIDPEKGMMGAAPIVAGTIPLALGAALASSIRKDKRITVSFFGDGATGEGVLYECLNFAALKKLPLIFACENNLYSTHLPIDEIRPNRDVFRIGEPFGIECHRVDGNDVVDVYETVKGAVEKCRNGRGPVFIEFLTYRLRGHVGPDDNIQGTHMDIRSEEEIERWRKRDPITRFEKFLDKNKILSEEDFHVIKAEITREVKGAHDFALKSSCPKEGDLTDHVFEE